MKESRMILLASQAAAALLAEDLEAARQHLTKLAAADNRELTGLANEILEQIESRPDVSTWLYHECEDYANDLRVALDTACCNPY